MDERLVALGLARPAEPPPVAPPADPISIPVARIPAVATEEIDLRLLALGLGPAAPAPIVAPPVTRLAPAPAARPAPPRAARPASLPAARPVAAPAARPAPPPIARPVAAPAARPAPPPVVRPTPAPPATSAAPVAPAPPIALKPFTLAPAKPEPAGHQIPAVRQAIRVREGWRDLDALCEVDGSGVHVSGALERFIPWPDLRSITVKGDRITIVSPSGEIDVAVAPDGVSEPGLAPMFARVLEEGRSGELDPTGALHELALGNDKTVETFADADDPVVPIVVGAFALVAAIMLGAAIPMIVVLAAHLQGVPLGTFAILPRVASFDPRVIVAAFASAIALASAAGRLALGPSLDAWARGTLRGWHRSSQRFEPAARRIGAWLMLRPGKAGLVAAVALVTLLPAVFARTTLDPQGIHDASGLPFISHERSWTQLADVTSVPVGLGERVEGFDVQLVLSDGSTISTRGRDLIGGTERAFYDFAQAQAR
jgi:hypothetical protein